ncbi:MAG: membrane protein insertase YidC, partial [Patiriisocius sp.]
MEEKKFDLNTIIGFVLIGAIFIWMLYLQQPTQEEIAAQEAEIEAQEKAAADLEAAKASSSDVTLSEATQGMISPSATDSLGKLKLQNRLGSFAYSASLPSASDATTTIENDVLS